ncbi:MAG: SH3 domain-containing protein [Planctomycetia bacterium]|nr:SH3 domain-containing protein [Planctomycetia bacterium]
MSLIQKEINKNSLFWGIFLCICGLMSVGEEKTFGEEFPYTAIINDDSVYIYSGPGSTYYTTDVFQKGDSVEVYQHLPGGWCAIRPPAGSFAWVPRNYLQPLGDSLARITSDDVPSRIGSKLYPMRREQISVMLRSGKVVEILDDSPMNGNWCKISPPSGEFRWVQEKYLSPPQAVKESPVLSVAESERTGTGSSAERPAASRNFLRHVNLLEADLSRTIANYDASRWDTPSLLMRANSLVNRAETVTQKEQIALVRQKILEADAVRNRKIALLKIEANSEKQSPVLANQKMMHSEGQDFYQGFNRSPQNYAARNPETVNILDSYQLGENETYGNASGENFSRGNVLVGNVAERNSSREEEFSRMSPPYSTTPGRYEYEGVLATVQPREKQHFSLPRYALVDDRGLPRCYVTPVPGQDLTRYVGARVAISGTQVYLPEHSAWNLTARQIKDLSSTARR